MAHDINAVKKCLKDAGLYEENMDTKVMLEYYDVIKKSENTASVECEVRKSKEDMTKKMEVPKKVEEEEDGLQLEESDVEPEKPSPKSAKSKKEVVNFSDMPACTEKMLDVVYHEPKYFSAVNFNSEAYKKLSLSQKVGLLFKYHTSLGKQMAALARRSIHPAPRPKDIQSSYRFNGSLLKDSFDNYDYMEQSSDASIYTSRSGRQTKRKKYNEDFEYDEDVRNKKQKNDENSLTGKLKAAEKKNTPLAQTGDQAQPSPSQTGKNMLTPNTNISNLDTPTSSKSETAPPLPKRAGLRKLTNDDIMKRSSLFAPISLKKPRAESKSRSELMFDKLKEDEKKKRLVEKETEIFERSLQDIDLEDMPELSQVTSEVNGTHSPPKRVSGRRAVNARKRLTPEYEDADSTNKVAKNVSKSIANRSFLRNSAITSDIDLDAIEIEATSDQLVHVEQIECPLCGVEYPKEDIQQHAATCCEPIDTSQSQITLRSSVKS